MHIIIQIIFDLLMKEIVVVDIFTGDLISFITQTFSNLSRKISNSCQNSNHFHGKQLQYISFAIKPPVFFHRMC